MSTKWMPTTEQVRTAYAIDSEDEYRDPINAPANRRANERYFDRWLAAHDAKVRDAALKEAAELAHEHRFDRSTFGVSKRLNWAVVSVETAIRALRSGAEGNTDVER